MFSERGRFCALAQGWRGSQQRLENLFGVSIQGRLQGSTQAGLAPEDLCRV
jgi:hypothetical protein